MNKEKRIGKIKNEIKIQHDRIYNLEKTLRL